MGGFGGPELHFAASLSKLVPRTDRQTIVAAVNAVPHRDAELMRDLPLMLDGEVGNTAPRIEPVRRWERPSRAGIQAAAAGTAMTGIRRIRRQFRRRENRPQE